MLGALGQVLVPGDDVFKQGLVDLKAVVALLEGDAEDVTALDGVGLIVGVDLHHVVGALFLCLEDGKGLVSIAGGNDAVGHLRGKEPGGGLVAHVAQGGPVAVGAQTVAAPGLDIGAGDGGGVMSVGKIDLFFHLGQRRAKGGPGGGDVLEGGGGGQAGGLFQRAHQLPGVEGVHEVDVARPAVEHGQGQIPAAVHKDAGGLLVGVAAVFQFQFVHCSSLPMLVDDGCFGVAGGKVGVAHEEGHPVVLVEGQPHVPGQGLGVGGGDGHRPGLALKGG